MSAFKFQLDTLSNDQVVCGPDGCFPRGDSEDPGSASAYSRAGVGRKVRVGLPSTSATSTESPAQQTGSSSSSSSSSSGRGRRRGGGKPTITVDVWSDVICPWCYYGKRGLDVAMRASADKFRFEVRWHPFMIRPDAPRAGRTPAESGIGTRDRPYFHYIKERAMDAYGLDMGGKCDRYPHTLKAHSLLLWALRADASKQHGLMERVFRAYYAQNRFVGSDAVLLELAAEAGYTAAQVAQARAWLESGAGEAEVWAQYERAARSGLTGVPDFALSLSAAGRGQGGARRVLAKTQIHGGAAASAFEAAFRELEAGAGPAASA